MSSYCYLLLLLATFSAVVTAQRPSFGRCPSMNNLPAVELHKLKGQWYEVERSFYMFELHRKCIGVYIQPQGKVAKLTTTFKNRITDNSGTDQATATQYGNNSPKLRLIVEGSMSDPIRRVLPGSGDYFILTTDYDNYAVIYSCSNMASLLHADLVWVLSRERELSPKFRVDIYDAMIKHGLKSDILTLTNQKDCS